LWGKKAPDLKKGLHLGKERVRRKNLEDGGGGGGGDLISETKKDDCKVFRLYE